MLRRLRLRLIHCSNIMSNLRTLAFLAVVSLFARICSGASHSNNWALIVGASRYWFNYRHVANPLAIYHSVKAMGIPGERLVS